MQVQIGSNLGPYKILGFIGAGGMGEVYRALDSRLLREVAVKIIPSEWIHDSQRVARFEREARAAGAINHPNILAVYDVGISEGLPYLVTELLEGESLRQVVDRGRMPTRIAIQSAVQIASGLSAAHERGIIHRDLKPDNIFLTRDELVKILDFGLAKLSNSLPQVTDSRMSTAADTEPGTLMGTVLYSSPEQLQGSEADHRSDLFAFGITLCEMLLGHRPFSGRTTPEVMSAILRDDPDFQGMESVTPPELKRIVARCLSKDPSERFQSARELTLALRMIEADMWTRFGLGDVGLESEEAGVKSIAVLAFRDLSAQKDQEYFCDGVSEELITAFTRIPGLRVASRTSAFQFKNSQIDVRQIAERLGVDTVLEGSVRKAGNKIRITGELIDANTGYHLWSERYDRASDDIFQVQEEIARTIAETLQVQFVSRMGTAPIHRYTGDPEAYELYLKGRHHWKSRTSLGQEKAVECFRKAIDRDPEYALAYAGLADCYSIYGFYSFRRPAEVYPLAIGAAEKSLELNPLLAEGHLSLGAALAYFDWNWPRGEREFLRAVELDPSFGLAHCWYSGFLSLAGRFEEGLVAAQKALQIDPLSPLFSSFLGFNYYHAHKYDQALQQLQKALEIEPDFVLGLWYSGLCYMKKEMYDQSLDCIKKAVEISQSSSFFVAYVGLVQGLAGNTQEAEGILRSLQERSITEYVAPSHFARVLLGLGRVDSMFSELNRAFAERNVLVYLPYSPEFDSVRSDPRFQLLLDGLARVGR